MARLWHDSPSRESTTRRLVQLWRKIAISFAAAANYDALGELPMLAPMGWLGQRPSLLMLTGAMPQAPAYPRLNNKQR
jgi:hypothetical protein